ncbi:hypothetical protein [Adhaeretor mobilis]|uniref:Uncharacterized protein n=1 Tax=Adhaeretor mobilis TaxID=1930276 RepID=A0A517MXE4_9BACT|nr:hypothetical protein [Adhaeretor mobilis]QDS99556.1 hypothetical protein HG15A2_28800 [Adhaeretor mobilis]
MTFTAPMIQSDCEQTEMLQESHVGLLRGQLTLITVIALAILLRSLTLNGLPGFVDSDFGEETVPVQVETMP